MLLWCVVLRHIQPLEESVAPRLIDEELSTLAVDGVGALHGASIAQLTLMMPGSATTMASTNGNGHVLCLQLLLCRLMFL